jgi:hypothetical protein
MRSWSTCWDGCGAGQESEDDPPRRAQQLAEVAGPVGVHQAAVSGLLQLADATGTQVDRRQDVMGLGHPHLVALVAEGPVPARDPAPAAAGAGSAGPVLERRMT